MEQNKTIVVAYGDGIGPEIMDATLKILQHAEAKINVETIEIGEKLYTKGYASGISPEAWNKVMLHKVLLKAPITTPQGKGYKSLNVTFRKALGLYANIRPCASFYPVIDSPNNNMDLVICRENEEDLYAGIEYRPSFNTAIAHKMITRQGSRKIIRYAFEYARNNGRKKVTALVKDNIMKVADGMFHEEFKKIAQEYQDIESTSMIVDIGSARIAARPKDFDVIVTLNLYGDIISDIAAEVSGSVGLAGSSNIGDDFGMFEAVHGSAPDIAGLGIANPSGLLNGAILMLEYLGQTTEAGIIKNAWLKTIEDGIHTADIYKDGISKRKVGTSDFANAVIERLGERPSILKPYSAKSSSRSLPNSPTENLINEKKLIGVDFMIDTTGKTLEYTANALESIGGNFKLHLISQRGLKVWPESGTKISDTEIMNCRFIGFEDSGMTHSMIVSLYEKVTAAGFDVTATHTLYSYGTNLGFTKAQGE